MDELIDVTCPLDVSRDEVETILSHFLEYLDIPIQQKTRVFTRLIDYLDCDTTNTIQNIATKLKKFEYVLRMECLCDVSQWNIAFQNFQQLI